MKSCWRFIVWCLLVVSAQAQPVESPGGFRGVLEIVGIEPAALGAINPDQPSAADWQLLGQINSRLEQHAADLGRWTQPMLEFSAETVGELLDVQGTVEQVDEISSPDGLEPSKLYRCRMKLADGNAAMVLAAHVPRRWQLATPLAEPVSLRGVLLQANGAALLLTTHVSWFPREGLPAGQLLLASFGMDAALWDDVVQRTAFVSPERGREAQAFYACLAAIAKVPAAKLAALTLEAIAKSAAQRPVAHTKQDKQIAAAIAEQAELGLSSVAPLFLEPQEQLGQLVRIEGTARRAVRIVADDQSVSGGQQAIREYYELEVFTSDSQNLPIVCCVVRLPAGFPVGDAIRAGVRLDGVFFKLWRYHSRKAAEPAGETTTPQQSYTPVVMAATVTWLRQASTPERWWGLAVGGIVFVVIMGGLLRMIVSSRTRPRPLTDEAPDFSALDDK